MKVCLVCEVIKGNCVMIKIYFHVAIASGVVYLILGIILLFLYMSVSKTLIKGIKTVSELLLFWKLIKLKQLIQLDSRRVQWFSIFILVILSMNVFLLIITVASKNPDKTFSTVFFSVMAVFNTYSFMISSSLQNVFLEEEEAAANIRAARRAWIF